MCCNSGKCQLKLDFSQEIFYVLAYFQAIGYKCEILGQVTSLHIKVGFTSCGINSCNKPRKWCGMLLLLEEVSFVEMSLLTTNYFKTSCRLYSRKPWKAGQVSVLKFDWGLILVNGKLTIFSEGFWNISCDRQINGLYILCSNLECESSFNANTFTKLL